MTTKMKNIVIILLALLAFAVLTRVSYAAQVNKKIEDHNNLIFNGVCSNEIEVYLYDMSGTVVYTSSAKCVNGAFTFTDQIDRWHLPDGAYKVVVFEKGENPDISKGDTFTLNRQVIVNQPSSTPSSGLDTNATDSSQQEVTTTGSATVSGSLRVKSNGFFEGILSVVDTLLTKNFIVSGISQFFGDIFFKGNVFFTGRPTYNSDTAGFALIKKGAQKVTVTFDQEYATRPVITANISLSTDNDATESAVLSGVGYTIVDVTTKGFSIKLATVAPDDIPFSWSALSVSNAKTSIGTK